MPEEERKSFLYFSSEFKQDILHFLILQNVYACLDIDGILDVHGPNVRISKTISIDICLI